MNIKSFNPFPTLTSTRLFLRNIEESDAEVILFLRSDQTVNTYIERPEHRQTRTISEAVTFIKKTHKNIEHNRSISWGITLRNEPQIIGTICLWNFSEDHKTAEVGYDLNPEFQGKGFMSEALILIINFGFMQLKLNKIEAFTHFENERSKTLLTKNGFNLNEDRKDSDNVSNLIYELDNFKS